MESRTVGVEYGISDGQSPLSSTIVLVKRFIGLDSMVSSVIYGIIESIGREALFSLM